MAETKKKPAVKKSAVKKPGTTAKPAVAIKPPVKKAVAKKATVKKPAAKKSASGKLNKISAEERYRMVEMAAYYMAERNRFAGNPASYWAAAEAQIKKMLS